MRVRYFAWFDSKAEQTEFIKLLNDSRTENEAINKVAQKYPDLRMSEIAGIVDNFKKQINNHET
jgi:molybdopterin converting factor small subunit